jgi:hypothetical protein
MLLKEECPSKAFLPNFGPPFAMGLFLSCPQTAKEPVACPTRQHDAARPATRKQQNVSCPNSCQDGHPFCHPVPSGLPRPSGGSPCVQTGPLLPQPRLPDIALPPTPRVWRRQRVGVLRPGDGDGRNELRRHGLRWAPCTGYAARADASSPGASTVAPTSPAASSTSPRAWRAPSASTVSAGCGVASGGGVLRVASRQHVLSQSPPPTRQGVGGPSSSLGWGRRS